MDVVMLYVSPTCVCPRCNHTERVNKISPGRRAKDNNQNIKKISEAQNEKWKKKGGQDKVCPKQEEEKDAIDVITGTKMSPIDKESSESHSIPSLFFVWIKERPADLDAVSLPDFSRRCVWRNEINLNERLSGCWRIRNKKREGGLLTRFWGRYIKGWELCDCPLLVPLGSIRLMGSCQCKKE